MHRDYKPENVLVDGAGVSKLTDFGIAARAGDRPIPAGTLVYAPPEQFAGAPASPATDVYAATATFYECLTGRPPFAGQHRRDADAPASGRAGAAGAGARAAAAAGRGGHGQGTPAAAHRRHLFVAALQAAAVGEYGPDWEERGRSHLGEAALLLAALWPSGDPPAVGGFTVEEIPLWQRRSRMIKVAFVAAVVIVVAAAGTALAATRLSHATVPVHLSQPPAATQHVSLQATSVSPSPSLSPSPSPSPTPSPTTAPAVVPTFVAPPTTAPTTAKPTPKPTKKPTPTPTPKPTPTPTPSPTPTPTPSPTCIRCG